MGDAPSSKSSSKQSTTSTSTTAVGDIGLTGQNAIDALTGLVTAGTVNANTALAVVNNTGANQTTTSLANNQLLSQLAWSNLQATNSFLASQNNSAAVGLASQIAAQSENNDFLKSLVGLQGQTAQTALSLGAVQANAAYASQDSTVRAIAELAQGNNVSNNYTLDRIAQSNLGAVESLAKYQADATGSVVAATSSAFQSLASNFTTGINTLATRNGETTIATLKALEAMSRRTVPNESADSVLKSTDNTKLILVAAVVVTIGIIALSR